MNLAAVCCPGPGLPLSWPPRGNGYPSVWVVNRALLVVEAADWLSAGDVGLYQGLLGAHRPRKGCLTTKATTDHIRHDPSWGEVRTWEDSPLIQAHHKRREVQWSIQAALLGAAELGAGEIDLYGTGRRGDQAEDCTGYPGENRNPARWAREAADLAFTYEFLRAEGVRVNRILHDTERTPENVR